MAAPETTSHTQGQSQTMLRTLLTRAALVLGGSAIALAQEAALPAASLDALVDAFVDARFEAPKNATQELLDALKARGISTASALEELLRGRRASYPDLAERRGKYTLHPVECYYVDYASNFWMYVPQDYDPTRAYSLVVVGHGGNSSMSAARAERTAEQYLKLYAPGVCSAIDAIVVAPCSERGWGPIGYSLVFSTISAVKRMAPIDPDRIYLTGQSMGGHLTYRAALLFPDAWGAVSPHSGGYDFVAKGSIANLDSVPGLSIFGAREPYGINGDNKTNAKWAEEHGLDWSFIEKDGGHEIYGDELPGMAEFFGAHPRDLYRERVYFRQGGAMLFTKPWNIEGWPEHTVASETRPLRWNRKHWVEVRAREDSKDHQELLAINQGNNRIRITCHQVRHLTLYFHPKMVDFAKPVTIEVNGKVEFEESLEPDLALMLDQAREFDDRGRAYWTKVELSIESDHAVEFPKAD